MWLHACQFEFQFPRPAMLMGIVNVTPDSFSDGGRFFDPAHAVEQALQLVAEGADILDIGGESTRPGATPVSEEEELRRVLPVIRGIVAAFPNGERGGSARAASGGSEEPASQREAFHLGPSSPILISIDTMKPEVARAAVAAGASIINDVAANRSNPAMWDVVRETGAGYVVMHMQGTPQTMQREPRYDDVVRAVGEFFRERLNALRAHGVSADQIVFDPGIGFGKTTEHNLELLAGLAQFRACERPVLIGVSRKAFIGKAGGAGEAVDRLPGSLACACAAVAAGAQIIRTHDVAATRQALRMTEAIHVRRK